MRSESLHLVLLVCLIASSGLCRAQAKSGAEVLARCEKNMEGIEDYVVDLTAEVDMEGVRMPRMEATMYFKKPDKVHFESPNFAMLPREGFGTPVSLLIGRYNATSGGEEMSGEIPPHKLPLLARRPAARLQQLYVGVNKTSPPVVRSESVPYQGRA